jgi:hypothetical protein
MVTAALKYSVLVLKDASPVALGKGMKNVLSIDSPERRQKKMFRPLDKTEVILW